MRHQAGIPRLGGAFAIELLTHIYNEQLIERLNWKTKPFQSDARHNTGI